MLKALGSSRDPGRDEGRKRLHAIVFEDPELTLSAVRSLRAAGFVVADVHTPFPVHGMAEAMGLAETRLGFAALTGGILGAVLAMGFQLWSHVRSWPLYIGGKDLVAWPALVPVTFELAVLLAAFATVGALVVRRRLRPQRGAPMQPKPAVTDDRFVIVVEERDACFIAERFRRLAEDCGSTELIEGWRVL